MPIITGIYKITNTINGKVYIGCSSNIMRRWTAHKSEARIEGHPQYNYAIHKAFRKYGIENFQFEIIEQIPSDKLFEREIYWINYYDSYLNGYNETPGGDCGPVGKGENNPRAILTEQDIINIRTLLMNGKMPSEVYPLYSNKISLRAFEHVWRGENWIDIMPEAIEYVKSKEYLNKVRSFARYSNISEEKKHMWEEIREYKKKGLKRLDVYEKYKQHYSLSGFNNIWYKK